MTISILARDGLDFGLPTDNGPAMEAFYEHDLGLELLHRDTIIEGNDEVFYQVHGSWLKLNPSVHAMDPAVTGYRELLVASDEVAEPTTRRDPDGLAVTLVPPGHRGIDEVGMVIEANDVDAHVRFVIDGMGAVALGDGYRVGNTVMFFEPLATPKRITPIVRRGFTMLTLVVHDLPSAHRHLIACGGAHGLRMSTDPGVPGRCLFSFVRDPSGNWIELCQFADLSGPLPTLTEPDPTMEEFLAFRDHGIPA
jgi:lactoylglutathione lyase